MHPKGDSTIQVFLRNRVPQLADAKKRREERVGVISEIELCNEVLDYDLEDLDG